MCTCWTTPCRLWMRTWAATFSTPASAACCWSRPASWSRTRPRYPIDLAFIFIIYIAVHIPGLGFRYIHTCTYSMYISIYILIHGVVLRTIQGPTTLLALHPPVQVRAVNLGRPMKGLGWLASSITLQGHVACLASGSGFRVQGSGFMKCKLVTPLVIPGCSTPDHLDRTAGMLAAYYQLLV